METKQARFWAYVGGQKVLIKLRQGQRLYHDSSGTFDEYCSAEGWCERNVWSLKGDFVFFTRSYSGTDCDGSTQSFDRYFCHIMRLCEPRRLGEREVLPSWRRWTKEGWEGR